MKYAYYLKNMNEFDKPEQGYGREYEMEKFPEDNQKYKYNNYNQGQDNIQNNNLIYDDMDLEVNRAQYPEGIKEENSQNASRRIEEEERINLQIFKGFLVKVYGILSVQLIITLFFIFLFQKDSIKEYFSENSGMAVFLNLISAVVFFITLIMISTNPNLGKKVPNNYISLLVITICMSLMCALFAINYSFQIVLFCVILTIISSVTITIYAYSSNTDWRYTRGLVAVILSQCAGFILMVFILNITFLEMVCCFFFTLLFGVYLVYDTQEIMRKYGEVYSIDDYIYASLQIYLDIARLFLAILAAIGKAKK